MSREPNDMDEDQYLDMIETESADEYNERFARDEAEWDSRRGQETVRDVLREAFVPVFGGEE